MVAKKKPRKSGANIPEAQRHTMKLQLRVPPETVKQIDALRENFTRETQASGWTRSDIVKALVDSEFNALAPRPSSTARRRASS